VRKPNIVDREEVKTERKESCATSEHRQRSHIAKGVTSPKESHRRRGEGGDREKRGLCEN
jgi:hypothetical protein